MTSLFDQFLDFRYNQLLQQKEDALARGGEITDYQVGMDSSPVGSVGAPGGIQPNPYSKEKLQTPDDVQLALDTASYVPALDTVADPAAWAWKLYKNPEERTLSNYALTALSATPFVAGPVMFHGTNKTGFKTEDLRPWTHFGTREAAQEAAKRNPNYNFMGDTAFPKGANIHKADVEVYKPLRIRDENVEHGAREYLQAIYRADAMDKETYKLFNKFLDMSPPKDISGKEVNKWLAEHEEDALKLLGKLLEEQGYDGLVYKNLAEGLGGDSYVTIRGGQVGPAFGKPVDLVEPLMSEFSPAEILALSQMEYFDPMYSPDGKFVEQMTESVMNSRGKQDILRAFDAKEMDAAFKLRTDPEKAEKLYNKFKKAYKTIQRSK